MVHYSVWEQYWPSAWEHISPLNATFGCGNICIDRILNYLPVNTEHEGDTDPSDSYNSMRENNYCFNFWIKRALPKELIWKHAAAQSVTGASSPAVGHDVLMQCSTSCWVAQVEVGSWQQLLYSPHGPSEARPHASSLGCLVTAKWWGFSPARWWSVWCCWMLDFASRICAWFKHASLSHAARSRFLTVFLFSY